MAAFISDVTCFRALQRMVLGMLLAALSFIIAAILQTHIDVSCHFELRVLVHT